METTSATEGYLAFTPGFFTRHMVGSRDEGLALCGAPAHAQGEALPAEALRLSCPACKAAVA